MCDRFATIYNTWSREKKNAVYFALAGHYYCPFCRKVHTVDYKEETV